MASSERTPRRTSPDRLACSRRESGGQDRVARRRYAVAAERILRSGFLTLEEMGEQGYLSTRSPACLPRPCSSRGLDEAEEFSRVGELACAETDIEAQALWRQNRARVLAIRGDLHAAQGLAEEAVRLNEGTDAPIALGEALMDLAGPGRIAGRLREAAAGMERAIGEHPWQRRSRPRGRCPVGSLRARAVATALRGWCICHGGGRWRSRASRREWPFYVLRLVIPEM